MAFEANLAPFWDGFGSQVGTKLAPNRSKNRSKKQSKNLSHFVSTFGRLLLDFGANLEPKSRRKMFVMLAYVGSWSHLGAKMAPGPPQDPPRRPPGSILDRFWTDFGPILDRFWIDFERFGGPFFNEF